MNNFKNLRNYEKFLVPKTVGVKLTIHNNKKEEISPEDLYGESTLWKDVTEILKNEKTYGYKDYPNRSSKHKGLLKKLFSTLNFFADNKEYDIDSFVEFVKLKVYKKDEIIFDVNDIYKKERPRYFYIVLYGFVSTFVPKSALERQDKSKKQKKEKEYGSSRIEYQYSKGDSFGEDCISKSFLAEIPKNKSVIWKTSNAVDECGLLCLNWDIYLKYLYLIHETKLHKRCIFLKNLTVPVFSQYKDNILLKLAKVLKEYEFQNGEVILKQNHPSSDMYFIYDGECVVLKYLRFLNKKNNEDEDYNKNKNKTEEKKKKKKKESGGKVRYFKLAVLKTGEYFGERVLLTHSHLPLKSNISVYSSTKSIILSLSKLHYTTFVERSKSAQKNLKKYAQGYPTDKDIKSIYQRKKTWNNYKKKLLENINIKTKNIL